MGREIECRLLYRQKSFTGKAYLESDFLLFRGERRLKFAFTELSRVSAEKGCLKLVCGDDEATLELGEAAEKWARKITNPPSLLDKLGIKPGIAVMVSGDFEPGFLNELGATTKGKADLILVAAQSRAELAKLVTFGKRLTPRGAIWVVFPKGVAEIREVEVIQAGRAAGFKDTKVARFSSTHTALRFSQPASAIRS